jgi:phage baseplate assembly protein V
VNQIFNEVKKLAQSHQIAYMRAGTVTSYDPSNYTVKVALQPEGAVTGWIPLVSAWVGNGWGMFSPPSIGDLIEVQFHDGDFDAGVACQRFFNDSSRPLPVPGGEFWLVHKLGALVKLTNDGKVTITDKAGSTAILNGDGTATVTASGGLTVNANTQINGNLSVSGNVGAGGTVTAPNVVGTTNVTFGGKSGVAHTHSGVQTGPGNTGAPN